MVQWARALALVLQSLWSLLWRKFDGSLTWELPRAMDAGTPLPPPKKKKRKKQEWSGVGKERRGLQCCADKCVKLALKGKKKKESQQGLISMMLSPLVKTHHSVNGFPRHSL